MRTSSLIFMLAFIVILVLTPVMLLLLPVPILNSHALLEWQYTRTWFPPDEFGYTVEDRIRNGRIVVDYLHGNASLDQLDGMEQDEKDHMADVRDLLNAASIVLWSSMAAIFLSVALLFSRPSLRKKALIALQRGAQVTIALLIILVGLFSYNWIRAFDRLHRIVFDNLNWMFFDDQVLLRLFPDIFWRTAAILYGVIVLLSTLIILVLTSKTVRRLLL